MTKQELNERLLDEVIRYALAEIVEEMENDLPSREELKLKYSPSPQLDAKIQKIIKEEERKEKFAQFRKTALKVAAVMIAFLAVSFFTVMNVEALKVRITNYFMVKNEKSTTIRVNNEQLSTIMPTYLPEGYENVHLKVLEDFYYAIYENQNGDKMILQLIKEKSAVGIDTEKTSVGTVKVKGNDAEFYYKEEVSFLVFKYNDMLFSLHGKVPKKELIKVAESMEYTK